MTQIKKWLQEHPSFRLADEFKNICNPLEQFGICHFSHVSVNNEGQFSLISQNPAFLQHYIESSYYHFDVIQFMPQSHEHYLIRDLQSVSGRTKQLQIDFNAHGFGHAFTIVKSSTEQTDFYNFAARLGNSAINEQYLQKLHDLKQFIYYFHNKVNTHKELAQAYGYQLSLRSNQSGFQINTNLKEQSLSLDPTSRIYIPNRNTYLTLREYECLSWLAKGKTQEQIALILNISLRTIKAHILQIREKLGCVNQFQLGVVYAELNQFQNAK